MASLLAASASASAARRRLPILMSFYARLSSTTCYFELREGVREREGRSEGQNLGKMKKIYDTRRTFLQIPGYNESEIKDGYKMPQPLTAEASDISPKPQTADIVVPAFDKYSYQYFNAYSFDEEDVSMSPKYYVYPPSIIRKKWNFHGATCNGVFHLMNKDWEQILWNPTTEECKTLPMPFVPEPRLVAEMMVSGMWYDHTREDYKLLQLVRSNALDEDVCYWIWWYSLKSNSWKKTPCPDIEVHKPTSACINGVYYCIASFGPEKSRGIMSFNVSTETLSRIHLPFIDKEYARYWVLEYKGLLSIIVCPPGPIFVPDPDDVRTKYELWVMNDGLWIRESVFHVRGVREPIWFSKNGRFLYFESLEDEVVVFDRASGKWKNLGIYCYSDELKIYPFAESFVQLNGVEELETEEEDDGDAQRL